MDLDIAGNAAVVTASSSGLGQASATALAREGADVVLNGRDEARLEAAVDAVRAEASGRVVGHAGDLTDPDVPAALVDRALDAFGRLDHLVTSAGGPPPLAPLEATDDDWYAAVDLLLMSAVRSVRAAAPHLRADGGGTVVHVTSRVVKEASPSNVLSSAVRMGVVGFAKTLSTTLAPEVRVNCVLPGAHETPRIEETIGAAVERGEFQDYEAGVAARTGAIPVGRMGDPMEFGDTVAYLSSPRSGFVNGVALVHDGGSGRSTL